MVTTTESVDVLIRALTKRFILRDQSSFLALEDVGLSVVDGEFLSVVGPSGCGKSTILKIVAGLIPFDEGQVEVTGNPVEGPGSKHVGMVFQESELLPWRTALENVLFPANLRGRSLSRDLRMRAHQLLEMVGIGAFADVHPHQLSGGMRQRTAICRALLMEPDVLLMDEPFGAVDALTREKLVTDLQAILASTQSTVLFVTHDIQEAVLLSDRVAVMERNPGRIVDIISIPLERPRTLEIVGTQEFSDLSEHIRAVLSASAGTDYSAEGAVLDPTPPLGSKQDRLGDVTGTEWL